MELSAFHHILLLLGVAILMVALFHYFKLPQILAYLVTGIIIGPYGLGWLSNTSEVRFLAEFGLVFLLFSIGLEFSLPRLVAMRRLVLGLGGAQVLITCTVFAAFLWFLDMPIEAAILIGGVLSLSSTALVMKLLADQLEQNSRHGRAAFGVLLFQDLIVVPLMIMIPAMAGAGEQSTSVLLGLALVKSVVVLVAIMLAGRWLLRPLFHQVAATKSREVFMMTVLFVVLGASGLSHMAGLSLALGAFFAGMMLSETEFRHQVEGDILPFRDMLMGLFFVSIGMLLDVNILTTYWQWLLLAVAGMVLFKSLLITLLGKMFGLDSGVSFRTGLVLAQGGEFGFALMIEAQKYQLLDKEVSQVIFAAIVVSMLIAPFLIRHNGRLVKSLIPGYIERRSSNLESMRDESGHFQAHVIICGYGRSGQNLAWMMEQDGVSSLALDLDPVRVRDARDAGKPVVFGDATQRDVLVAAGLDHARALTISFNDVPSAMKILANTRSLRPDLPIIVRTVDDVDMEKLYAAGATEVVPESLEGSLMIGSHILQALGAPVRDIINQIRFARSDRYRLLRGFFHGEEIDSISDPLAYQVRLHSVILPENAASIGQTLTELDLASFDVNVTAIRRGGIRGPQPSPDLKLLAGDVLVLYGNQEALDKAEIFLLKG
jgi:CPA2 family monovalent cation:H+ antiporter-2